MNSPLSVKIIAACGNDCSACPRYVKHPYEKTEDELRRTADLWMRIGYRDHIVTNREISCEGCSPENWCRYHVVKCCEDRGIRTCAACAEYPCENIRECFEVTRSFEPKCREVCSEAEYEMLKTAFFEKEQNLDRLKETDILIRTMTIEDYDSVYELWTSTEQSARALNPVDDSRDGIARYLRRNPSTCFVACRNDDPRKVIGVILTGHDGRRGIVHHMCVRPDHRRQGIARSLVRKAEAALQAEGISKVFGLVFKDNDAANAFWEEQGYTLRTNLNYRNKSINPDVPQGG